MSKEKVLIALPIFLYVVLRLISLVQLPIFVDESIHIYWAKLIASTNKQWFISLIDGEPPLFIWSIVVFLKVLPSSWYLVAGRLPSVLGEIGILWGMLELGKVFKVPFSQKIILLLLLVLSPFLFFYSGLASYDMFMACFFVWTIVYTLKASESLSKKDAVILGVFAGLTVLSKASGTIALYMPIPLLLLYTTKWKRNITNIGITVLVFIVTSQIIIHSLMFSRGYTDYVHNSLERYISTNLFQSITHFPLVLYWIVSYITYPILILSICSISIAAFTSFRKFLFYFIVSIFPVCLITILSNNPGSRYFLFTIPFLLFAASDVIAVLYKKSKLLVFTIVFLFLIPSMLFIGSLVITPIHALLPAQDYEEYISGQSSGYGLSQVFSYLDHQKKPIHIITLGTVSSFPYAFNLYYWDNPKVTIDAIWPVTNTTDQYIRKSENTFVILKMNSYTNHKNFLSDLGLKEVFAGQKPGGNFPVIVGVPH